MSLFLFAGELLKTPPRRPPVFRPRAILLALLCIALNGCFTLEQPYNSVLEFYPRWRWFIGVIEQVPARVPLPHWVKIFEGMNSCCMVCFRSLPTYYCPLGYVYSKKKIDRFICVCIYIYYIIY